MNGTDSDSCTGPPAGLQLTTASPLADGWRPRQTARATPHQVDGRTTPVTATTTRTPFCPAWPMHVGPPRCRCARNSSPFMDTGLPERGRRPARQAHRKRLHQHKRPAGSPSAAASPSWTSGSAASTITLACSSSCGGFRMAAGPDTAAGHPLTLGGAAAFGCTLGRVAQQGFPTVR